MIGAGENDDVEEEKKGDGGQLDFSRLLTDDYFEKPPKEEPIVGECYIEERMARAESFDEIGREEISEAEQ